MSLSRGLSSLSVVSDDMSISKCSQNSDDYTETELSQFSTISTQSKEAKVDYMEIVNNVRQPSCCCNRNQVWMQYVYTYMYIYTLPRVFMRVNMRVYNPVCM